MNRYPIVATVALLLSGQAAAGEKMQVTVIDRQDSASVYSYSAPGYATTTSNAYAGCTSYGNTTNCNGSGTAFTTSVPGRVGSYQVRGATLSLLLPDGRIAVVNCEAKYNWTEFSNPNMYRSCRVPLVSKIQAEFSGEKAKLSWPVSIDGKKLKSETYKIIAVLEKPEPPAQQPSGDR